MARPVWCYVIGGLRGAQPTWRGSEKGRVRAFVCPKVFEHPSFPPSVVTIACCTCLDFEFRDGVVAACAIESNRINSNIFESSQPNFAQSESNPIECNIVQSDLVEVFVLVFTSTPPPPPDRAFSLQRGQLVR